jgi:membrane-associated phosphatidylinositol transfer protein
MFKAHTQAWAWMDEWHGLTIDDIRQIERQTQEALKKKMGKGGADADDDDDDDKEDSNESQGDSAGSPTSNGMSAPMMMSSIEKPAPPITQVESAGEEDDEDERTVADSMPSEELSVKRKVGSRSNSRVALNSPGTGGSRGFDANNASWRMESIVRDSDSASEEEFFDCQGELGWKSRNLIALLETLRHTIHGLCLEYRMELVPLMYRLYFFTPYLSAHPYLQSQPSCCTIINRTQK